MAVLLVAAFAASAAAQQATRGTMTTAGQVVQLDTRGASTASIAVSGTWSGTVNFEVVAGGGTDPVTVDCATPAAPGTAVNNTTSGGVWVCPVAGMLAVQARLSDAPTGTVVVDIVSSPAPGQTVAAAGGGGGGNDAASATGSSVPASASYNAVNVGGTLRGQTGTSVGSHYAGAVQIMDGSGNAITSFGGGTQYTQDAALTVSTTVGTMAIGRASAAVPSDVSADGDAVIPWYLRSGAQAMQVTFGGVLASTGNGTSGTGVQRVTIASDSTGTLAATQSGTWNITNVSGTVSLPTGAATAANQSTEITALQLIDNLPLTIGSTTSGSSGALAFGAVSTSAPTYTTAQNHPLSLTTGGLLRVAVEAGGGTGGTSSSIASSFPATATAVGFSDGTNMQGARVFDADSGAGTSYVLGTNLRFAASGGSVEAFTSSNPGIVAGTVTPADNTSPTNAVPVTNYNMCYDGTNWDRCTVSTGGSGTIDANTTRVVIATDDPVNDAAVKQDANMVAHDAVDAGNPIKIGAKATTSLSSPTPVANGDRTDLIGDADGALITRPFSNLADRVSAVVGVTDGSSTSLVAAQGAGIRFCATAVTVSNSSATNVTVDLRDGTAGSVIWTFPAAANMGGATLAFPTPLCTSANTALAMDPSSAATTVTVSIIGFKTKL